MRGHDVSGSLKMKTAKKIALLGLFLTACQSENLPPDLRQHERIVPQTLNVSLLCGDGRSETCTFHHRQFSQTLTLRIGNNTPQPMWVYLLNSKGVPTIQVYYHDAQNNRVRVDMGNLHKWRKRVQIPAGGEYIIPFKITQLDMRQAQQARLYAQSNHLDIVLPENGTTLWFKDYLDFEFVK